MPPTESIPTPTSARVSTLLLTGVIAIAVVGYFVGIRAGAPVRPETFIEATMTPKSAAAPVPPAVTYTELREVRRGPNVGWRSHLDTLVQRPRPVDPEIAADPALKRATLARRQSRRAYNGAPPVVPHTIDQLTSAACLACHESAVRVGDLSASRIPHPYLSSCTQCHVEQGPPGLGAAAPVDNTFAGLPAPFEGSRAWPGAPPLIPHSTLMRTDCLSCHGPAGAPGMQTTHPQRHACVQCHAPSALLDQYGAADPFDRLPAPVIVPE